MEELGKLFKEFTGVFPKDVSEIPRSVSTRKYYRLQGGGKSIIGTYSPDKRETKAFVTFSGIFNKSGIHVPEVYMVSRDLKYYLQEDLGNQTLHDLLISGKFNLTDSNIKSYYRLAIDELVRMQVLGDEQIDYSICVPRPEFDAQSVLWDLYHFKYYFLKPAGLPFDEQLLEESFQHIASGISSLDTKGFMFRDFQSRNIMVKDGMVYLIDFQGGRRGPLQYDLASLVFESRTVLSADERNELIDYYLNSITSLRNIDQERFSADFYLVALVRILQALGAYGLRGMIEKKAVFIQSIPHGLRNLDYILQRIQDAAISSYFFDLLKELTGLGDKFRELPEPFNGLTITVFSFSYRNRLPDDISGNGGGVVYDCRFLENPGLQDSLKQNTGLDQPVINFLEKDQVVSDYLVSVKNQLEMMISSYANRGYNNLMVSFGCTGGQHRSVYMARKTADWLRLKENLRIIEIHRELQLKF